VALPVGTTHERPVRQLAFCVHDAPTSPIPAHAQSVVSPSYTKQERPVAQPTVPLPVGSQGREQAAKSGDVDPQWMGTLQKAFGSPQAALLGLQKRRHVMTEHPRALNAKHCDPVSQSLLLAQTSPGFPAPAT